MAGDLPDTVYLPGTGVPSLRFGAQGKIRVRGITRPGFPVFRGTAVRSDAGAFFACGQQDMAADFCTSPAVRIPSAGLFLRFFAWPSVRDPYQ